MQEKKLAPFWCMAFGLCGLAFSVMSVPALAGESVLYAFKGGDDGVAPIGSLLNLNGLLYGMTNSGGAFGYGTIFSLTPEGEKTTLYSFRSGSDGANPIGGLTNFDGALYGNTTSGGGSANCTGGCGTVFSITPSGTEKVIVSLPGGNGPSAPLMAGLINVDGKLYGTTLLGGGSQNCGKNFGCGTVYSVTQQGKLAIVYAFQGHTVGDGDAPNATLIHVGGMLYGTTVYGGAGADVGTVFSLTTSGQEKILYQFKGFYKPRNPAASLICLGGTLYGTALQGAGNSPRVSAAFLLRPSGVFKELHQFGGAGDGNFPQSLMASHNVFYGVAAEGGAAGYGTLFSLTKTGTETQLYSFAGGSDASTPQQQTHRSQRHLLRHQLKRRRLQKLQERMRHGVHVHAVGCNALWHCTTLPDFGDGKGAAPLPPPSGAMPKRIAPYVLPILSTPSRRRQSLKIGANHLYAPTA